jgi:predicted DNA-binding transcriptional regulator YafY
MAVRAKCNDWVAQNHDIWPAALALDRIIGMWNPCADMPRSDSVVLMRLSLAIQRAERVQLWYQSGAAETERCVDPYGLVFHWGCWYLAAWCHLRQAIRVFRLDRVVALEPVPEMFARPVGFDSLTCVTESLAMAPWGWEVEVLLKATLETVERQLSAGWAILEKHPEGIVLRGQYDRLDWIAAQLLLLNCPLMVRRPPELVEALRVFGERASALAQAQDKRIGE